MRAPPRQSPHGQELCLPVGRHVLFHGKRHPLELGSSVMGLAVQPHTKPAGPLLKRSFATLKGVANRLPNLCVFKSS